MELLSKDNEGKVMNMQTLLNEGGVDRGMRIIIGAVVISLVFWGPQSPWGWLGVIPLVTGLIGWCPAYSLFGIKTCKLHR